MEKEIILKLRKAFEECAQQAQGVEFWFARDLQKLLGYDEWRNFSKVIEKAKIACKNSGYQISDHFPDIGKLVEVGSGSRSKGDEALFDRLTKIFSFQHTFAFLFHVD